MNPPADRRAGIVDGNAQAPEHRRDPRECAVDGRSALGVEPQQRGLVGAWQRHDVLLAQHVIGEGTWRLLDRGQAIERTDDVRHVFVVAREAVGLDGLAASLAPPKPMPASRRRALAFVGVFVCALILSLAVVVNVFRSPTLAEQLAASGESYRQGNYHETIKQCSTVLAEDPDSVPALFRRARGNDGTYQFVG